MKCWWLFFHKWSNWSTRDAWGFQFRICSKCDRIQKRFV